MSAADEEALRAPGLGIDGMDADEFHAMMEDEGEEVEFDDRRVLPPESLNGDDEVENGGFDHDSVSLKSDEIGPTQELEEYKVGWNLYFQTVLDIDSQCHTVLQATI